MEDSMILNLLNLKKIDVETINSTKTFDKVLISITLARKTCTCPNCHSTDATIKDYYTVNIRNSIALDQDTVVLLKRRRFICKDCGKTFVEPNPLTNNTQSTISTRTELNVLRDLKQPSITFTYVANKNNISPTQAMRIFDRYINYSRNTLPIHVCVDEVYISPGSNYKYACIIYDYDTRKVVDVIQGRRKEDLEKYFSSIPQAERNAVKIAVSDMWRPYQDVFATYFPNSIRSVDSFHVIKEINTQLTKKRCQIMNQYKGIMNNPNSPRSETNEARKMYYLLKTFHKLLLTNYDNLEVKEKRWNKVFNRQLDTMDLLGLLLSVSDDLTTLYELKEQYIEFNSNKDMTSSIAPEALDKIIYNFQKAAIDSTGLGCCNGIATMLSSWRSEIINSFPASKGANRYHNGIAESCNAIIKKMIVAQNGIRNFDRFRNRILYVMDPSDRLVHQDKVNRKPNIVDLNAHAAKKRKK